MGEFPIGASGWIEHARVRKDVWGKRVLVSSSAVELNSDCSTSSINGAVVRINHIYLVGGFFEYHAVVRIAATGHFVPGVLDPELAIRCRTKKLHENPLVAHQARVSLCEEVPLVSNGIVGKQRVWERGVVVQAGIEVARDTRKRQQEVFAHLKVCDRIAKKLKVKWHRHRV